MGYTFRQLSSRSADHPLNELVMCPLECFLVARTPVFCQSNSLCKLEGGRAIIIQLRFCDPLVSPTPLSVVSSMTFGREDPVMKTLHEQMKSYLNKEQQAMEERIRKFEEAERETFSQLQKKTHSERTSLFS